MHIWYWKLAWEGTRGTSCRQLHIISTSHAALTRKCSVGRLFYWGWALSSCKSWLLPFCHSFLWVASSQAVLMIQVTQEVSNQIERSCHQNLQEQETCWGKMTMIILAQSKEISATGIGNVSLSHSCNVAVNVYATLLVSQHFEYCSLWHQKSNKV